MCKEVAVTFLAIIPLTILFFREVPLKRIAMGMIAWNPYCSKHKQDEWYYFHSIILHYFIYPSYEIHDDKSKYCFGQKVMYKDVLVGYIN